MTISQMMKASDPEALRRLAKDFDKQATEVGGAEWCAFMAVTLRACAARIEMGELGNLQRANDGEP